jgi:hypothetical protein
MTRMKALQEENRRIKKLCIEAQTDADIVTDAFEGDVISPTRGEPMGGRKRAEYLSGPRAWSEGKLISLPSQSKC